MAKVAPQPGNQRQLHSRLRFSPGGVTSRTKAHNPKRSPMTWLPTNPQGFESDKCRFDVLPFLSRGGMDIGCGPKKVWPHMMGIDSCVDTQLFGIQMKPDIVVKSAERLGLFADNAAENVFSSHLLEHIEDWGAALREWWRIVKPGGHLVLYLPHADLYPNVGQPGANPDHKHDFTPADLLAFFTLAFPDWTLLANETRDQADEYSFLLVLRKEPTGTGQNDASTQPIAKSAGLVRVGAHGDAIWASSPCALLKEQGYHVTAYVATTGGEILKHDPNIDRLVVIPDGVLSDEDLLAYWAHEAAKHDKWVNLIGSVEQRLLFHPSSNEFFLSHKLRHKFADKNYMEMVHDYADLPHDFRQKYYPTAAELDWARAVKAKLPGGADTPLVVLNPCGSGPAKTWPHAQAFMERMNTAGINCVVLGDLRLPLEEVEPHGIVVGTDWPVRAALAFAQLADCVVATESLIANSVAQESMLKVIILSHSSNENLTKHWNNTAALQATSVSCYPCHRVHGATLTFCAKDTTTGASACMASATADTVADFVVERLVAQAVEVA
jgi:ADP-heptose:LPS heptosyltransferase/predicted SAM-dependent methyltransferase